jgi:RNA polymerase sigma factor (sigma-70 family)
MENKDYRVTIKVRNNNILKAIEGVDGEPGAKWCKKNGLNYVRINDLINMTISPINKDGNLTNQAGKLCDVTGKLAEELWSNEQLYPLEKNFSELEMSYSQVMRISSREVARLDFQEYEEEQEQEVLKNGMAKMLSELSPRTQDVLRSIYFEDKTLTKTAEEMGISSSRVMQIHEKALRMLRHPKRSIALIDCVHHELIGESIGGFIKEKYEELKKPIIDNIYG